MYDRDSIDLLDDLLHENGHHILNTILNTKELIYENQLKNYYSPWRRSMRPIRGIFHGYLTFFWAFLLFTKIEKNLSHLSFSASEIEKIALRRREEYQMLNYSFEDLELAYAKKEVTDEGIELVREVQQIILEHEPTTSSSPLIQSLAKTLKEKRIELNKFI